MKRSKKIVLILLGSVSAMGLVGCDESPSIQDGTPIYETVDQCNSETGNVQRCTDAFKQALGNHVSMSPQFYNEKDCIGAHDTCVNVNSANPQGVWIPAMIGYIVGSTIAHSRPVYLATENRDDQNRGVVAGPHTHGVSPVFVGSYYNSGGSYASGSLTNGMSSGAARVGATTATVAKPAVASAGARSASVSTSAAARGGFGASGAGVSSGG